MAVIGQIFLENDHQVMWQIRNFFTYAEVDSSYSSPSFSMLGSIWRLEVWPKGQTLTNSSGYVSLYLHGSGVPSSSQGASYSFGVEKADRSVRELFTNFTWVFSENCTGLGFPKFLKRSMLMGKILEYGPRATLKIVCTMRKETDFEFSGRMSILSRDLAELFSSKKYCDATMVVRGKAFKVHKSILSARSAVLASMFETDMMEKETGVVEIPDCDPGVFEEFLRYLYCGKFENIYNKSTELYKIAHKYDVKDLQSYCCTFLMNHLSLENVLDAVVFGDIFNQVEITKRAQKYFNGNFRRIMFTTQWDDFLLNYTGLANKLLKGMANERTSVLMIEDLYL